LPQIHRTVEIISQSADQQAANVCVLIPTYNNAGTVADVIKSVLDYTPHIIVVNDGSTDDTQQLLPQFSSIQLISYQPNRGKGYALRTGIKAAAEAGYDYAIAIDSDGQHFAHDIPAFLSQIEKTPGALIIGARNLNQENVPGKSSFGNRFSNFWYWIETGRKLPDTQSGYRLYPVKKLAKKRYFTRKYEFEIEVLVRAAWSGIPVISIPVSVYYPPAEERVSHFRPFRDFTRISMLNTVLVLIAFLWIKPRDFIRPLFKKEGWVRLWQLLFVTPHESNHVKAASISFGVFMGIVPIWGFQLLIGIPLALLFRLNKGLFIVAANISIFPFTPFILFASLVTGNWLLGYKTIPSVHHISLTEVKQAGFAFFLGGTVLAIAAGLTAYLVAYLVLLITRRKKQSLQNSF
jgi:glycosyltransferase involved in cell wall biosynthesis